MESFFNSFMIFRHFFIYLFLLAQQADKRGHPYLSKISEKCTESRLMLSRISKFALREQFLYMCSCCNLVFYFAEIILFVNQNCLKP